MKRIVYLSFYFQPDLCAGSFRNSPLAIELASIAKDRGIIIDVYTTLPNRYSSFEISAPQFEQIENLNIHRILLPPHKSGMLDQILCFRRYFSEVLKLNQNKSSDLVFASSSRLFTAFLGYILANKTKTPLYLDIRDIFVDTMSDVFKSKVLKIGILPFLKFIERKIFNYACHINLISGGFKEYFLKFGKPNFTFFTNGIDEEFLISQGNEKKSKIKKDKQTIVYAGNLGEGQGLHKIIPQAARLLGMSFEFVIIGDGGAKSLLQKEIIRLNLNNVILKKPIQRVELQSIYADSDYLFLHLNDYPAFRKVLPSKIFELATFGKPIIAGVSGYAAEFIRNEVSNSFVFEPCNSKQLVDYLRTDMGSNSIERKDFKLKFRRSIINKMMAESILSYT
jgi:glycosyltransferase involved in cell wall biosynthesis